MKKHVFLLYIMMGLCPTVGTHAQEKISAIRTSRIEVTDWLDAQITPQMRSVLAPYKTGVDSLMAPVLGQSRIGMGSGRPESLLGNWAADALVWATRTTDSLPSADFGLINVGGLRNSMPQGTVRRGDILLISPFINHLTVCELTGDVVLELMENIASVGGEAVSREVRMEIGTDGRLKSATLNGEPIDPQRTYRLATIDYLAEGNDKMVALKKSSKKHITDLLASDVMMNCVKESGTIDAKIEGRVIVTE